MLQHKERVPLKVNEEAFSFAKELISNGKIKDGGRWNDNQLFAKKAKDFLEQHTIQDYRKWFLAEDHRFATDVSERYLCPIGNFDELHISALIEIKQNAHEAGQDEIEKAADHLLAKAGHKK